MAARQRRDPARVRFILKDKSEKETLIYLTIRVNKKRVKWSTRDKVDPRNWNSSTRRAIVRARSYGAQQLNERLDKYARTALELYADWQLDTPQGLTAFNQDKFKLELDYRLGMQARPADKGDVLDTSDFIRFAETLRDHRKDSTSIVRGTWKVLNNHVNLLREFADLRHGGAVGFAEVDDIFIDAFKKFLFRKKQHNRRTVAKVLTSLRSIASRAAGRGLMTYGPDFKRWTKQDYRKLPQPAFNRAELDKIIAIDLSDDQRLERVRDLFLIGVATAQRWSDYSKLTPRNFKPIPGGYRYNITSQQKTSSRAGGPVMSWALPILRKYGYIGDEEFAPPKISGQKFNDYLKEVVKLALPESTVTIYNDGEHIDHDGEEVAKWTVTSSHAARRTAVGLLRSMGAPDDQIQKMTGHKTLSELDGYDVRDAETLAIQLGNNLNRAWSKGGLRVAE